MVSVLLSLLLTLRPLARSRAALHLEILALRHQLDVRQRTRPQRVRLARTDRWLWVMLGPLGPGFLRTFGENSRRYFRCVSA